MICQVPCGMRDSHTPSSVFKSVRFRSEMPSIMLSSGLPLGHTLTPGISTSTVSLYVKRKKYTIQLQMV